VYGFYFASCINIII